MIPRILHIIWVGDDSRRPGRCIQTWVDHHPDWTVKLWGNPQLEAGNWFNAEHMKAMAGKEWNGVADMMRWEILEAEGGVLVDADSVCVRPLPDWLLECEAFSCWENELVRPGLIAAGYFGSVPGTPFLAELIQGIKAKETVVDRMAWETVGPLHLTETWRRTQYGNLTILPSHFFIPRHFTGATYTGGGPVFARQEWGSTLRRYDALADDAPGQAFLCTPRWDQAEWVEVLLSYLEAFTPEDPVALILVLDPGASPDQARAAVAAMIARTGRASWPELRFADTPARLAELLRRHPRATWIPPGRGRTEGLRGPLGQRLAEARRKMAIAPE